MLISSNITVLLVRVVKEYESKKNINIDRLKH